MKLVQRSYFYLQFSNWYIFFFNTFPLALFPINSLELEENRSSKRPTFLSPLPWYLYNCSFLNPFDTLIWPYYNTHCWAVTTQELLCTMQPYANHVRTSRTMPPHHVSSFWESLVLHSIMSLKGLECGGHAHKMASMACGGLCILDVLLHRQLGGRRADQTGNTGVLREFQLGWWKTERLLTTYLTNQVLTILCMDAPIHIASCLQTHLKLAE